MSGGDDESALTSASEWSTRLGFKPGETSLDDAIRADWSAWTRALWDEFASTLEEWRLDFEAMPPERRMRVSDVSVIFEGAFAVYQSIASAQQREALAFAMVNAMSPNLYATGMVRSLLGMLSQLDGGHCELLLKLRAHWAAAQNAIREGRRLTPLELSDLEKSLAADLGGLGVTVSFRDTPPTHLTGRGALLADLVSPPPVLTAGYVVASSSGVDLDALDQAVADAGNLLGFSIERKWAPMFGSFRVRWRLLWSAFRSSKEVQKVAGLVEEAARLKHIEKVKAEVTMDYATALEKVTAVAGNADRVAVVVGPMLYLKFRSDDGQVNVLVKELTQAEQENLARGASASPTQLLEHLIHVSRERPRLHVVGADTALPA